MRILLLLLLTTSLNAQRIQVESSTSFNARFIKGTDSDSTKQWDYIQPGQYADYYVTPGNYTFNMRVASPLSRGAFDIRTSTGLKMLSIQVPNTGGWAVWKTIATDLVIPAGVTSIRIQATGGDWNFNWFELVSKVSLADAGRDTTIYYPVDSYRLTGIGTWRQIGGVQHNGALVGTLATNLYNGTYRYELTAPGGAKDTVQIMAVKDPGAVLRTHVLAGSTITVYVDGNISTWNK